AGASRSAPDGLRRRARPETVNGIAAHRGRNATTQLASLPGRVDEPIPFGTHSASNVLAKVADLAWAELTFAENHRYRAAQQERPPVRTGCNPQSGIRRTPVPEQPPDPTTLRARP